MTKATVLRDGEQTGVVIFDDGEVNARPAEETQGTLGEFLALTGA
jgi:hypothetical protein